MAKKSIFLIDGTSICYRSFFAIKLSTAAGFPTGAVYGVYNTLKKIISKYKPDYLSVCFDVSRKTHRAEKFKDYKANRPPLPDPLKLQLPIIRKLISALGINMVEKEGYEADDVIATLCKKAVKEDLAVVIVSSDKDLYQLITSADVTMYNYMKDKIIDRRGFRKQFGFSPELIVDYLSLVGDTSDNIPGARGIGKVGATKLIEEFGTIESLFNNLDKIKPKMRELLKKNKDQIYLSRELIVLSDCHVPLTLKNFQIKAPDQDILQKMFKDLEFKTLIKTEGISSKKINLELKENPPEKLINKLFKKSIFFFVNNEFTFTYDPEEACLYKFKTLSLKSIFSNKNAKKISYGFKNATIENPNCEFVGLSFDIKIAAYLLDSSLADYEFTTLVTHYLHESINEADTHLYPYYIYRLYKVLETRLKDNGLEDLFFDVEMPLIEILARMQIDGVKVDIKVLKSLLEAVDKKTKKAEVQAFKIARKEFNLNSPKQLSEVLFHDLKIKPIKKTKTGFSTNEEVLDKLSPKYPIAAVILDYRHLTKLRNTYILPLIEDVQKKAGMLHAQFHQTNTQTGRLSSSSPNLQSIPVKGEFSDWLRKAFTSNYKGGLLLSADYSQIELRILAHLSGDKNLVKAFNQDLDIHSFTAGLLFDLDPKEVSDSQRAIAKRVNFGIIYGMSSYGLAKELKITPLEAEDFIDDYFERYKGVKKYIKETYSQAEDNGYSETILGRRRKLTEIHSENMHIREFARRQAVNAPIQGSCADLIKIAMIKIHKELRGNKLKTKLILQIHDELVFDVPAEELDKVKVFIRDYMQEALKLTVPIKVNLKVGKNWGQMQNLNC